MGYSKNITIDENGPKITTNGTVVFKDLTLSLRDFAPNVTKWSNITLNLNKGEEFVIDGKWSFLYVRMRWLDYNDHSSTGDGSASIYDACSSNAVISKNCGCNSDGNTPTDGKTKIVPSLATMEMTQYTEYLLSSNFIYVDTDIELTGGSTGASGATGTTLEVKDLYDHRHDAVLSGNVIYFKDAMEGPTAGATTSPYPPTEDFYMYTNQSSNIIFIYDIDIKEWVLISTDTDINELDGTINTPVNVLDGYAWSLNSHELGNSMTFIPELNNINGTITIDGSLDLEDENMPTTFKFSDVLMLNAFKYTGKITSDLDNQEITIMLGY